MYHTKIAKRQRAMVISDFVRSSQVFCIISLLCYIVCSVILIAAFVLKCLHRSRVALIVLSLLTFTSGKHSILKCHHRSKVALIFYSLQTITSSKQVVLKYLHRPRDALLVLSLLTFISGKHFTVSQVPVQETLSSLPANLMHQTRPWPKSILANQEQTHAHRNLSD